MVSLTSKFVVKASMFTCGEPEAAGGGSVTSSRGVGRMNIVLFIPQRDEEQIKRRDLPGRGQVFPHSYRRPCSGLALL